MHPPRVAAGKNLAFWPLGWIFRDSGAFFIRRRFHGARLYAEVLFAYIKTLIKTGYNLEFFIEGGRSRTGKLVLPKMGLLHMILRAYKEGAAPDLYLVPTFIGQETVGQLVKARKFLKGRYGRAYIQFSEPISIKDYLARHPEKYDLEQPEDIRKLSLDLSFQVIQAINQVSVVTPFSLVCAALLTYPRKGVYRRELFHIIQVLDDYLRHQAVLKADSLDNLAQSVEETLVLCESRKLVTPIEKEEGLTDELGLGGYSIDESKRPLLEYYKNNIIHFFLPASMTSLAILAGQGFEFDREQLLGDFRFLQDLFKYEFVYNDAAPEAQVDQTLSYFASRGVIVSVFRSIKYLQKKPRSEKEFLKRIHNIGNKLYKLGEVERSEALSDANFQNALKLFGEKGIITKRLPEGKGATTFSPPTDEDVKDYYGRQLARFLRR